jgi:hypothetical protein
MNEEAIEFVHAYVSRHFLNVQMARSDYLQTADAFYMKRMLQELKAQFEKVEAVPMTKKQAVQSTVTRMEQDTYIIQQSVRQ